mmetsp:Transcript_82256/g.180838  ORF Transcript_82256/g.180838 Transcript_82256/m.180838 type:complete len:363 (-) Transcript_82256:196-1284(-)
MGNGGVGGETREATLSLHSVHNVQHSPTETYYGMATTHTGVPETPVTSEQPAKLGLCLDSVVSVRIFLHDRTAANRNDRPIGQVSIPIADALKICGPGVFRTWFLLSPVEEYPDARQPGKFVDGFRDALRVSTRPKVTRLCLSILESSVNLSEWGMDGRERERSIFYSPLWFSHDQHVHLVKGYMDLLDSEPPPKNPKSANNPNQSSRVSADEEALAAREEQERMHQQQLERDFLELQNQLDQVTEEANKRIERGNEKIIKLKGELKELRDVNMPKAQAERETAQRRLAAAEAKRQALQQELASLDATSQSQGQTDLVGGPEDLSKLRHEVLVLAKQKEALMKMVQDVYGPAPDAGPEMGSS